MKSRLKAHDYSQVIIAHSERISHLFDLRRQLAQLTNIQRTHASSQQREICRERANKRQKYTTHNQILFTHSFCLLFIQIIYLIRQLFVSCQKNDTQRELTFEQKHKIQIIKCVCLHQCALSILWATHSHSDTEYCVPSLKNSYLLKCKETKANINKCETFCTK